MEASNYWSRVLRKRMNRRRFLTTAAVGGGGLVGLALVGCENGENGGPGPGSPSAATPTAAVEKTPIAGGKFVFAETFNPPLIDPHATTNVSAKTFNDLVYESVLTFRGGEDTASYVIEPLLVEAMPEQPDNLTYIFKLRPTVSWHDVAPANGRAVTAEDVRFSFDRMLTLEAGTTGAFSPYRNIFQTFDKMEAVDEQTLRVTLTRPFPSLLAQLAQSEVAVVNPEVVSQVTDLEKAPFVGTGPFIRTRWEPNVVAEHKRNDSYWAGSQYPYLDSFDVPIIPEVATRLAQLRAGAVDLFVGGVEERSSAESSIPGLQSVASPGASPECPVSLAVWLNPNYPPTSDRRVRQALAYAIDYDAFISGLASGEAIRIGYLHPVAWAHLGAFQADQLPSLDLEKAKQLLEAAGQGDGFDIKVMGSTARKFWTDGPVILKEQWAKIGVTVTPEPLEHSVFLKRFSDPSVNQGSVQSSFLDGADPDVFLPFEFHTGGAHAVLFNDPELDVPLDKLSLSGYDEAHKADIVELQEVLLDKMYKIPIMLPNGFALYPPTVHGPETQKLVAVRYPAFQAWNWWKEA